MRRLCAALTAVLAASCAPSATPGSSSMPSVVRYMMPGPAGAFSTDVTARLRLALPGVQVDSIKTPGSLVVLSALQQGSADFGFSLADVAYLAYRKGLDSEPYPHTNLRAIAVRWMSTMYVLVPKKGSLHRIQDLKGKRVGIVPIGSAAGELETRMLLEAHGIPDSDVQLVPMDLDSLVQRVHAGTLDAAMYPATPLNDVTVLIAKYGLRVIPLDRDVVRRLQAEYPFIQSVSLDTGLVGTTGPLSVGVDSVVVCRADLDERVVYSLTRVFYEILSDMARTRPGMDPNNAAAVPIPLHPGAARFYREQQVLDES